MIFHFVNDLKENLKIFEDFLSFLEIFRGIHGCGGARTVRHNLIFCVFDPDLQG